MRTIGQEPQRKANFTTAGREPCLTDGFILVPDREKMNDVTPPVNEDESADAKVGTPASIDEAPDLPENCDEELSDPPVKDKPSEALKGK